MSMGMVRDPFHPPLPCNMPSTPAPTYAPQAPQGPQGRRRADPNPYGPTNLILVTSTKPGKACQSCKRRQRGISRQQAGRQQARDGAGCVTFHPDVELAQLALQLVLQQTHVLGTGGQTVTHEQPPMGPSTLRPPQPAASPPCTPCSPCWPQPGSRVPPGCPASPCYKP